MTSIGNGAFEGLTSLISIIIPVGVTTIGYEAFKDCTSLTSIIIPDSVTSIGETAFNGCRKLIYVSAPERIYKKFPKFKRHSEGSTLPYNEGMELEDMTGKSIKPQVEAEEVRDWTNQEWLLSFRKKTSEKKDLSVTSSQNV